MWHVQSTAKAVLLTGRSGRLARPSDLHPFQAMDCLVTIFAGDCAQAEAAEGLLHCTSLERFRLGGITHAAGIQVDQFQI